MRYGAGVVVALVGSVLVACAGSSPAADTTRPRPPDAAAGAATTSATTTTSTSTSAATTTTTVAPRPVRPPSLGVGDALFPELGSADVDVIAYDIRLDVPAGSQPVDATMIIDAAVDPAVDVLALDASGLDIATVTVDGADATFDVAGTELLIDLPSERSEMLTAEITYRFMPGEQRSAVGLPIGWIPGDERSYVLNEPDGARTWMPVNDHPSDKADWRFEITVPPDRIAVANGELEPRRDGVDDSWTWVQDEPMSTYLVQVIIGDYDVIDGGSVPSIRGRPIPLTHVVPAGQLSAFEAAIDGIADRIGFFEERFGPFPLDRYGLAFVDDLRDLAMETQGRSMFGAADFETARRDFRELLLSHELAHQWFGNAVSPATWNDIWLNESLTSYAQWLWFDHIGLQPLDSYADAVLSRRQTGGGATGEPTLNDMFGFTRYDGGAAVVHALRAVMGDDAFFELMTRWVGDHVGTAQSTDTFEALAGEIHGADLGPFFDEWLYADTLPDTYP